MDRDAQAVYADSLLEKGGDAALRGELIQLGLLAKQNARQKKRFAEGELRVLSLEQNKIGIAGVQAIANTTCLTKLERVVTVHTWLAPPDVSAIEARFPGALVHTGQQKARR